jgi:hypothetical protein
MAPAPAVAAGAAAPGPVTRIHAVGGINEATFSWTNPAGPAFREVMIRRSDDAYSALRSADQGTLVYTGTGTKTLVSDLRRTTGYNFEFFTRGADGVWGSGTGFQLFHTRIDDDLFGDRIIQAGTALKLTGQLTNGHPGGGDIPEAPLAGRRLEIIRKLSEETDYRVVGSATTDGNGRFSAAVKPPHNAEYTLRYSEATDEIGTLGSDYNVMVMRSVKVTVNRTNGKLGKSFTFTVRVSPAESGLVASFQHGSGTTISKKKLTKGVATFVVKPTKRGTFYYRAATKKSATYHASYSNQVTIKAT